MDQNEIIVKEIIPRNEIKNIKNEEEENRSNNEHEIEKERVRNKHYNVRSNRTTSNYLIETGCSAVVVEPVNYEEALESLEKKIGNKQLIRIKIFA